MKMKQELHELSRRLEVRIDYLDSVASTNDVARDEKYRSGDMVVAESQTAGRGQRGNRWESGAGENLTFSLVVYPVFLPVEFQFLLPEVVTLAVADMLGSYDIEAQVKWPNDIYIGENKVAGILIENDICGPVLSRSIIGVGLNVNQTVFVSDAPNPVSMRLAAGRYFDRPEVLERFYMAFRLRYEALGAAQTREIEESYHGMLYMHDVPHVYKLPDGTSFTGIIRLVRPTGELKVEHPDGSIKGYLFKEIEF